MGGQQWQSWGVGLPPSVSETLMQTPDPVQEASNTPGRNLNPYAKPCSAKPKSTNNPGDPA